MSTDLVKGRQILLRGRVQGVGFRWFVCSAARQLGVVGWVRNLANGSVEIQVGGEAERIESLLAALRKGPPGAQVAEVEEHPIAARPEWIEFGIDPDGAAPGLEE